LVVAVTQQIDLSEAVGRMVASVLFRCYSHPEIRMREREVPSEEASE
jgi:hypothetical protein